MFKYLLVPYFGIVAVGKKWSTSRMYWRFLDLTVSLFSGWLSWSWLVCLHSFSAHAWRRGSFSESALAFLPSAAVCLPVAPKTAPLCELQPLSFLFSHSCQPLILAGLPKEIELSHINEYLYSARKHSIDIRKEPIKKKLFLILLIINDVSLAANQHI